MADVAERVRSTVARAVVDSTLPPGALLVVAVSGGQDSICLLDALVAAMPSIDVRLAVVHVDHRLRGAESTADAAAVARLSERYDLPFTLYQGNLQAYAKRYRLGLEEAGRYLRYQSLALAVRDLGGQYAATGHTADDLVELLLINMIRGSGLSGLTHTPPIQHLKRASLGPAVPDLTGGPVVAGAELRVLRPLVSLSRSDTEAYCHHLGLEFRVDASNLDPTFLRNRVRHHLIPLLRSYNPSITAGLGRLARLVTDDETELERTAGELWQAHADSRLGQVKLDWVIWITLSISMQRRLLRRACRELVGLDACSFQSLESARELLAQRHPRRRLSLGQGLILETSRSGFTLRLAELKP